MDLEVIQKRILELEAEAAILFKQTGEINEILKSPIGHKEGTDILEWIVINTNSKKIMPFVANTLLFCECIYNSNKVLQTIRYQYLNVPLDAKYMELFKYIIGSIGILVKEKVAAVNGTDLSNASQIEKAIELDNLLMKFANANYANGITHLKSKIVFDWDKYELDYSNVDSRAATGADCIELELNLSYASPNIFERAFGYDPSFSDEMGYLVNMLNYLKILDDFKV